MSDEQEPTPPDPGRVRRGWPPFQPTKPDPSRPHVVSEDFIEHLRGIGADKEVIEFTERYVPRYTREEMDNQFRAGCLLAVTAFIIVGLAIQLAHAAGVF